MMAFLVIHLMPIRGCQDQEFEQSYCCATFTQSMSYSQVNADLLSAHDAGKEPAFDVWAFKRARFVEPSKALRPLCATITTPRLHMISRVSCLSLSALL